MKTSFALIIFSFYSLLVNHLIAQEFTLEDRIYDPNVRTVQLFSTIATASSRLSSPIIPVGEQLILQFDEMGSSPYNYAAKIYNCRQDWKLSELSPLEYLSDFNEFYLTQFELSFNTKAKYVHYTFNVPIVKVSGNYVLKIYPRDNESEPILTRRFMVYEERTAISSNVAPLVGSEMAFRFQQVDLNVNYQPLTEAFNPMEQIKVVLRQNGRWDNAVYNLKPSAVRDFQKQLDFVYLNLENAFAGGNEFRIADLRNLNVFGFTIDSVFFGKKQNLVWLRKDASRKPFMYNRNMQDLNGRFYIDAFNTLRAELEGDYLKVQFFLKSANALNGAVYVRGAFNDFRFDENYKLIYDEKNAYYTLQTDLKQGLYDYIYTFIPQGGKPDDDFFEGTFSQTQNDYEVLVYFRPQGWRGDYLVGYRKF